jgi:sirohydrochlorin cobaltochelatase
VTASDALLLVAHGSDRYADAARGLEAHAAALRARARFTEVAVGVLSGTPAAADALARLTAETVHVVPFFMEDGYFTRAAIPAVLRAAGSARTLRYCAPVGTHPDLADLIERRVLRVCANARIAADTLTLILLAHGSARAPGRPKSAHDHAARLAAAGRFAAIRPAFLEEPPFLPDTLPPGEAPVAVVGLFAGEGGHVRDDVPRLIAEATAARSGAVLDLGFIGDDPGMPAIILDRVAHHVSG